MRKGLVVGLMTVVLLGACGDGGSTRADSSQAERLCRSWFRSAPDGSQLTDTSWMSRSDVAAGYPDADLSPLRGDRLAVCRVALDEPAPETSPGVTEVVAAVDRSGNSTWVGARPRS